MKALYIASSGMSAQERNVEVISNNIANLRTTGFKKQRAEFQDLLYQVYRRAGASTSDQRRQDHDPGALVEDVHRHPVRVRPVRRPPVEHAHLVPLLQERVDHM